MNIYTEGLPATRENNSFSRANGCVHDGMTDGWWIHEDLYEAVLNHYRQRVFDGVIIDPEEITISVFMNDPKRFA